MTASLPRTRLSTSLPAPIPNAPLVAFGIVTCPLRVNLGMYYLTSLEFRRKYDERPVPPEWDRHFSLRALNPSADVPNLHAGQARRPGEASVAGENRSLEQLRHGDVQRVVGAVVSTEGKSALHEWCVGHATDRQAANRSSALAPTLGDMLPRRTQRLTTERTSASRSSGATSSSPARAAAAANPLGVPSRNSTAAEASGTRMATSPRRGGSLRGPLQRTRRDRAAHAAPCLPRSRRGSGSSALA